MTEANANMPSSLPSSAGTTPSVPLPDDKDSAKESAGTETLNEPVYCLPTNTAFISTDSGACVLGASSTTDTSNISSHGNECQCGCVPKIPSLFQMAELRKQAKLQSLQSSSSQQERQGF